MLLIIVAFFLLILKYLLIQYIAMPPVRKNKSDSSSRTEKQSLESSGVISGQVSINVDILGTTFS